MNKILEGYIGELGVEFIYKDVSYSYRGFRGDDRFFEWMSDIVDNNRKVLIYPDCDPDGLMSARILLDTFKRLGHTNFTLIEYSHRDHHISYQAVTRAIMNNYDYFIVMDVGSNDYDKLLRLNSYGVKTIVIDHHNVNYSISDYPSNVLLINSTIENKYRSDVTYMCCGGSLTFMLCGEFLKQRDLQWVDLSIYALIALYADSINMMNSVNVGIYRMATSQTKDKFPLFVKHFMSHSRVELTRRFISFQLVPKINALFRTGNFGLLNKYMFHRNSFEEYSTIVEQIRELHDQSRGTVAFICDVIKPVLIETDNLVIVKLSDIDVSITTDLVNYTGLVANSITDELKKPCIVLSSTGTGIKGSFRDFSSRNYLELFKQICNCDGHPAAFGIHLKYFEVNDFIYNAKSLMNSKVGYRDLQEPIIIEDFSLVPNKDLIKEIAWYNEFSGIGTPRMMIKKKNRFKQLSSYYKSMYRYQWGDMVVESSSQLVQNTLLNIEPIYPGRLIVQTRGGIV